MIVFFHLVCLFGRYIANSLTGSIRSDENNKSVETKCCEVCQEVCESCSSKTDIHFYPPVYIQRYEAVSSILKDDQWRGKIKKVVEFGCAECSLCKYLKGVPGLMEVLEVDIDEALLQEFAHRAAPMHGDYLSRSREVPLTIAVMAGSVSEYDACLASTDAVVAVELIEHLYPEVLDHLPYNVFELIQPKLAIFTTPNADFNHLFPNMHGLRHPDHKFEWTRIEFEDWASNIVTRYPAYSVTFQGIGAGPRGTEHLGCCSQMAVFQRSEEELKKTVEHWPDKVTEYKLVKKYSYPHYVDTRRDEEKVFHETQYQLTRLNLWLPDCYNYEECVNEVPIGVIWGWVKQWCHSYTQLIEILSSHGMKFKERNGETVLLHSEDYGSHSHDEWSDQEEEPSGTYLTENDQQDLSDWDAPQEPPAPAARVAEVHPRQRPDCCEKPPRKRNFGEVAKKISPCGQRRRKPLVRPHSSYIRKSPRKISKSFSLDSCLENINCEPVEVQAFYLNLICSGARTRVRADSSSPLVDSSSCERAVDSGYPFSFTPHDTDLTPEQVDELATENEVTSARSSTSDESISQDEEEPAPEAARELRGAVFIEDPVVENGDLANNNRDGEGNNVEGVAGLQALALDFQPDPNDNDLVLLPEVENPFPPWLLNMVNMVDPAQGPAALMLYPDEGLGDDSSSDLDFEDADEKPNTLSGS